MELERSTCVTILLAALFLEAEPSATRRISSQTSYKSDVDRECIRWQSENTRETSEAVS